MIAVFYFIYALAICVIVLCYCAYWSDNSDNARKLRSMKSDYEDLHSQYKRLSNTLEERNQEIERLTSKLTKFGFLTNTKP